LARFPDVLHWVQLRGVGREGQQNDVVRHFEFTPWLVPAGPIAEQRCDRAWGDLCADLLEVQVHAFGIGGGCDDCRADRADRADGAEQVGAVVAIVAHHRRA
jgi:hypothetical protein